MPDIQNYQCPACGGPLKFDAADGRLKCPNCGGSYSPQEAGGQMAAKAARTPGDIPPPPRKNGWDTSALQGGWGQEAASLSSYTCPSCRAAFVAQKSADPICCPFCGTAGIKPAQVSGGTRPNYIIPFKVQKEQAVEALKAFYQKKKLLPKGFFNAKHLETAAGVFVPFWFFDGTASGSAVFEAQKKRGSGETKLAKFYECTRAGDLSFKMVPADASEQMDDALMDSLEPYKYGDVMDFSPSYLNGLPANMPDVGVEASTSRAAERCTATFLDALKGTLKGFDHSSIRVKEKHVSVSGGAVRLGLLPVWLLRTTYKGQTYTNAVNGQTGKVVGDLPANSWKIFRNFILRLAAIGAAGGVVIARLHAAGFFLMDKAQDAITFAVMDLIIAALWSMVEAAGMKTVAKAEGAKEYSDGGVRLTQNGDRFLYERGGATSTSRTGSSGSW